MPAKRGEQRASEHEGYDTRLRLAWKGRAGSDHNVDWIPDIALLDIDMPGLDGFALARRLRERTRQMNGVRIPHFLAVVCRTDEDQKVAD
jgi:DNA-binding response OmpR family regulator